MTLWEVLVVFVFLLWLSPAIWMAVAPNSYGNWLRRRFQGHFEEPPYVKKHGQMYIIVPGIVVLAIGWIVRTMAGE